MLATDHSQRPVGLFGAHGHTVYPTYWFGLYGVYMDKAGGVVLARIDNGYSAYFQPGDDANDFMAEADEVMNHLQDMDEDFAERRWNEFCGSYDDVMASPEQAGGAPSRDGGFFLWFLDRT